jgi:hypothetical protein
MDEYPGFSTNGPIANPIPLRDAAALAGTGLRFDFRT